MSASVVQREIRRVVIGGMQVPLGALAGTDTPHPFAPDGHTGTSCVACFGWCTDPRHNGRASIPAPMVVDGRPRR